MSRACRQHRWSRPIRMSTPCASPRNLIDRQLEQIRESSGMVGLNYSVGFLRADGMGTSDTGVDVMVRHIDYLIDKLGEDHVGLGSDFDGCTVPDGIKDVTGVPALFQALADHGYDAPLLAKLARDNWLACLDRTLSHDEGTGGYRAISTLNFGPLVTRSSAIQSGMSCSIARKAPVSPRSMMSVQPKLRSRSATAALAAASLPATKTVRFAEITRVDHQMGADAVERLDYADLGKGTVD